MFRFFAFNRLLKTVYRGAEARWKRAEKQSFYLIRRYLKSVFNAAVAMRSFLQQFVKPLNLILLSWLISNSSGIFANGFSFSAAADFTTGDYGGASSTDIWYVPFTARYDKDRASFRVIIPYLNMTGPGNVLGPGIGGIDGRGPFIGGGFLNGSPGSSGGGVVVCDEDKEDCSGENPGRGRRNSGSNRGRGEDDGDNNSGRGKGGDMDDDSGSGSGSGDDDDEDNNKNDEDNNSGSGKNGDATDSSGTGEGGNDNEGRNNDRDDDNFRSGNGGDEGEENHSGPSGSGREDNDGNAHRGEDDASEDSINPLRQDKISASSFVAGIPLGGSSLMRSTQSGLGDIITAFSYNLIDHVPSGIIFDITARLKIPTASTNQNMGSGQVDYAIQGDLFKTVSKFTLSATFGYRILGNPSGITFHNVLYGAAGIGYRLSPNITAGVSYNMGQSPVRLQDSRDLTFYLSHRVTDHFRLNIYGLRGFSERSPDWGGGINLRYIF